MAIKMKMNEAEAKLFESVKKSKQIPQGGDWTKTCFCKLAILSDLVDIEFVDNEDGTCSYQFAAGLKNLFITRQAAIRNAAHFAQLEAGIKILPL